jgi:PAS domain S-box-containing protein
MKSLPDKIAAQSGIAKRVLIIEKKQEHRQVFRELLRSHGWDSHFVGNFEDARTCLSAEPPYLHFIDSEFQEDEIREYVTSLATHDCAHTILATCDEYSQAKARGLLRHGVYDFIKIPPDPDELIPILERSRERSLLAKQNSQNREETVALEQAIASVIFSTKRISKHLSLTEFSQALMHEYSLILEATGGSFFLVEGKKLIRLYSLDPGHAPDEIQLPLKEESCLGLAHKTGQPVLSTDIIEEKIASPSGFAGYKDRSCLIIPLVHNGEDLIAFISLHDKKEKSFTRRDITIGTALAAVSAGLLRSLRSLAKAKENETRYERFFEDGLTVNFIASDDGRIILAHQAFDKILRLDSSHAAGPNIAVFFPAKKTWGILVRRLKNEKKIENIELELVGADGKHCTLFGNLSAHCNAEKESSWVSAALFDLTDKKQLERELHHSLKMEAIGRLAGGVAHDFNNLVTAIFGYCEIMADRIKDGECREEIEGIRRIGEKASALTKQLLYFSRKPTQEPSLVNLADVVCELERMLIRLIGEDIELCTDIKTKNALILADRGQIEQVILNLVVNARDAISRGGRITISLGLHNVVSQQHPALKPGRYFVLSVGDSGIGMDEETQRHIFEPFFSTKAKGKGTGLGLSTVSTVVKQTGGFIEVESAPGQGALFSVYFPKAKTSKIKETPAHESSVAPGGNEGIIVVDDDKVVRSIISKILIKLGYSVTAAADGQEALAFAKKAGAAFDLALIDMIMPSMSGVELASTLKKANPGLKVLFISGYSGKEHQKYGGGQVKKEDLISKPFHRDALAKKVREILDRS